MTHVPLLNLRWSPCEVCVFLCVCEDFHPLSHPFPLESCLKYFLANSNMSYLLSCRSLSSTSPSAKPSREILWKSTTGGEKHSKQMWKQKHTLCEGVSVYLNRLIYLMCSHGGRHGDSDGWWHSKLSRSSPWFCRAVQWQGQEVRRRDRMDALDWERTGAAEHRTKLPTWHAHTEQRDNNNQSYKSFNTWGALCPQTAVTSAVSPDHNLPLL